MKRTMLCLAVGFLAGVLAATVAASRLTARTPVESRLRLVEPRTDFTLVETVVSGSCYLAVATGAIIEVPRENCRR